MALDSYTKRWILILLAFVCLIQLAQVLGARPSSYILVDMASIHRRGRRTLYQHVFSKDEASSSFYWRKFDGESVRNYRSRSRQRGDMFIQTLEIPEPDKNTRKRFGSYLFQVPYDGGTDEILTFVQPETKELLSTGSQSIYLYPDPNNPRLVASRTSIGVRLGSVFQKEFRWRRNNGKLPSRKRSNFVPITEVSQEGIYEISRVKRARRGWKIHFQVTVAECPEGTRSSVIGSKRCDLPCGPCEHDGICNNNGECVCAPGFYGDSCEFVNSAPNNFGYDNMTFGQCKDAPGIYGKRCKGILICTTAPIRCQCAVGFTGTDCTIECDEGKFGLGCNRDCNCVDDSCTVYGECVNGCKEGYELSVSGTCVPTT